MKKKVKRGKLEKNEKVHKNKREKKRGMHCGLLL